MKTHHRIQLGLHTRRTLKGLTTLLFCIIMSSCGGGGSTNSGGTDEDQNSFSKLLGPTFNHPRCQTCHAFETENTSNIQHRDDGRLDQGCGECHFTPGWEAPFASFSFANLTNTEICIAIKNKTAGNLQHLKESVTNSTLAQWGIEDGGVLTGTLQTAPPGNMAEMARLLDQWIAAGASCN